MRSGKLIGSIFILGGVFFIASDIYSYITDVTSKRQLFIGLGMDAFIIITGWKLVPILVTKRRNRKQTK